MSSDDIAISVRNLGKTYRLFGHPGDRIKQFLSLGMRKYHNEFTALHDVSFDIKKGETVGIIGRNGSGKSTLLQLICGILKPTTGTVKVNGRISALLELGAGFNPEFTGRENVYFQGAVMGLSKDEMDSRFNEIAAFADIGGFIDQPVRVYSSGMFVRLAFAAAIHVDPDILVIDEALGVGDQAFQAKCLGHIDSLRGRGGTIVFVSHALEQIAHHCSEAVLLERGRMKASGDTASTLAEYLHNLESSSAKVSVPLSVSVAENSDGLIDNLLTHPSYLSGETRWGDGSALILAAQIRQGDLIDPVCVLVGELVEISFEVVFVRSVANSIFGLTIKSDRGATIVSANSRDLASALPDFPAGARVRVSFVIRPWLDTGRYYLSLGVASETAQGLLPHDRRYDVLSMSVMQPRTDSGAPDLRPAFVLEVLK